MAKNRRVTILGGFTVGNFGPTGFFEVDSSDQSDQTDVVGEGGGVVSGMGDCLLDSNVLGGIRADLVVILARRSLVSVAVPGGFHVVLAYSYAFSRKTQRGHSGEPNL